MQKAMMKWMRMLKRIGARCQLVCVLASLVVLALIWRLVAVIDINVSSRHVVILMFKQNLTCTMSASLAAVKKLAVELPT